MGHVMSDNDLQRLKNERLNNLKDHVHKNQKDKEKPRGGRGKSGHFYCFCFGNFLNESPEAIAFHVKVAFTHRFRADIVNSRVGPIGAHIFNKTCCGPIYPRWGKSGHFQLHLHIPLGAHDITRIFLPGCQELSWGLI